MANTLNYSILDECSVGPYYMRLTHYPLEAVEYKLSIICLDNISNSAGVVGGSAVFGDEADARACFEGYKPKLAALVAAMALGVEP